LYDEEGVQIPYIKSRINDQENKLGEQEGEEKGKITNQRVLGVEPAKMEISFSGTGNYRGAEGTVIVTYWSALGPDGVLSGEGQGLIMSQDGQEMASFTGQGIGRFVGPGKVRFVGSVFYKTASKGKLGFLNNMVAVFEHNVDESGNVSNKFWEWK
jgi:hypothetical protein